METKQIEQILSEIGITEDNCEFNIDAKSYLYEQNNYHELVEVIQKFMSHLEKQKSNQEEIDRLNKHFPISGYVEPFTPKHKKNNL